MIGVVTSPTGAVIRDILHRLSDRFPRHVLVWPVRVQGDTSAQEVAAAIAGFDALAPDGPIPRPDLLIVARGGGSLEDLWGFNEEAVVRAVAASSIPVIAAVGHETDWTLIDHVADMRAPTPTAAAELAVPVRGELMTRVEGLGLRAREALGRAGALARREMSQLGRRLPAPERLLEVPAQRLDRAGERIDYLTRDRLAGQERRLARAGAALERHQPRALLEARRRALAEISGRLSGVAPARLGGRARVDVSRICAALDKVVAARPRDLARDLAPLAARLVAGFEAGARLARADRRRRLADVGARLLRADLSRRETRSARLAATAALLESLSYRNVLARGYAVVRFMAPDGTAGAPATAGGLAPGAKVRLDFSDGSARAAGESVDGGAGPGPAASARKTPKKPGRDDPSQGALF